MTHRYAHIEADAQIAEIKPVVDQYASLDRAIDTAEASFASYLAANPEVNYDPLMTVLRLAPPAMTFLYLPTLRHQLISQLLTLAPKATIVW